MENITQDFDSLKYFLGKLCRYGHEWDSSGKSLRYLTVKRCVQCIRNGAAVYRLQHRQEAIEYNHRHRERISQQTKERRKTNKKYREHNRNYRLRHPERERSRKSSYRLQNYEQILEKNRLKWAKNRDKYLIQKRAYYYANREQILRGKARYYQTAAGKENHRRSEARRKALKLNALHVSYTRKEIRQRWAALQEQCAYCQIYLDFETEITVDHFIALNSGGTETLSNIVICCKSCNSSKQDSDPWIWYSRQSFFNESRWRKILEILGKSKAGYQQLSFF